MSDKQTHSGIPILEECMRIINADQGFKPIADKLMEEMWSLPTTSEVIDLWEHFYVPYCKKHNIPLPNEDRVKTEFKKLKQHVNEWDG